MVRPSTKAVAVGFLTLAQSSWTGAFQPTTTNRSTIPPKSSLKGSRKDSAGDNVCSNDDSTVELSRRKMFQRTASIAAASSIITTSSVEADAIDLPFQNKNAGTFQPSKRATAYLVDSTMPPTLVPFRASREAAILKKIGAGEGTAKSPYIEESINLNNMMNKGVFGTIDLVKNAVDASTKIGGTEIPDDDEFSNDKKKRAYDSSFVFLGMDYDDQSGQDVELAIGIMTDILKPRRGLTSAIALEFVPVSMQDALDSYIISNDENAENDLIEALVTQESISRSTLSSQIPIFRFAKAKQLKLIACSPITKDISTVRKEGLQNVDPDRRAGYLVDPQGFISWTQDPKNKLYTERSLLKGWDPVDEKDGPSNYFAERILVHETVATSIAKYAMKKPNSLIITLAPIEDVRFLGGMNGRLPRICQKIRPETNIDEEAITTILLNPSAKETLSLSNFLRLEIGTAPTNLQYQTKVADYLWFSTMPKVNMLPRLMNGY